MPSALPCGVGIKLGAVQAHRTHASLLRRLRVANVVLSQNFKMLMGCIILVNVVAIIIEADTDAKCYPEYFQNYQSCPTRSGTIAWLMALNITLLIIYLFECVARIYVERASFFCNKWNMIDFTTVFLGWLSIVLAATTASVVNLGLLRLLRLVRVFRAIRILIAIPEFYMLVTGLYSAIKAIFFGSAMLVLVIIFWAIAAVEMFHPILANFSPSVCESCRTAFSNVFDASCTLFQQSLSTTMTALQDVVSMKPT